MIVDPLGAVAQQFMTLGAAVVQEVAKLKLKPRNSVRWVSCASCQKARDLNPLPSDRDLYPLPSTDVFPQCTVRLGYGTAVRLEKLFWLLNSKQFCLLIQLQLALNCTVTTALSPLTLIKSAHDAPKSPHAYLDIAHQLQRFSRSQSRQCWLLLPLCATPSAVCAIQQAGWPSVQYAVAGPSPKRVVHATMPPSLIQVFLIMCF